MDDEKEWLGSLRDGDQVCIVSRFRDNEIRVIDRVTKTQIVIGQNKYRISDGYIVGGGSFNVTRIKKLNADLIYEIRRKRFIKEISNRSLEDLTLDQLERINSIIDEGKK